MTWFCIPPSRRNNGFSTVQVDKYVHTLVVSSPARRASAQASLPFSVDSHPLAQAPTGRAILARLASDTAVYAQQVTETEPVLSSLPPQPTATAVLTR
jgi:hypothetical protein